MSAKVLVVVCGGVAHYEVDGDVEVVVVDLDHLKEGDTVPASFADLAASVSAIPPECIEK